MLGQQALPGPQARTANGGGTPLPKGSAPLKIVVRGARIPNVIL